MESEKVRPLVIVTSPFSPYQYEDDGEVKGIAVEMLDRIMTNIGVDYTFELIPFTRALKLAEIGEVDGLWGVAYKEDRSGFLYYTPEQIALGERINELPDAYLYSFEVMFFIRTILKDSLRFDSHEQIAEDGYRVGVGQDYSYPPVIRDAPGTQVTFVGEREMLAALAEGNIDMVVSAKAIGLAILKENGLSEQITFIEKPLFSRVGYGIFTKNSDYPNIDALIEKVDLELIKIRESGEYDRIYDSYTQ